MNHERRSFPTLAGPFQRPLAVTVGVLALIGIVASATFFSRPPINPGFLTYPTVIAVHVVLGGLFLLFAPFQFVQRIRARWPAYHRWTGRLLVVGGLIAGFAAIFMGLVIPYAGWWSRVIISVFGVLYCLALVNGFIHIRAGRVAQHREWMIRAFAVGVAPAVDRLILIPAVILIFSNDVEPTQQQIAPIAAMAFTVAFFLSSAVAELWIHATRRKAKRVPIGATA
jgi:hypothetical protein